MTSPDEREQELRAELAFDGRDGAGSLLNRLEMRRVKAINGTCQYAVSGADSTHRVRLRGIETDGAFTSGVTEFPYAATPTVEATDVN